MAIDKLLVESCTIIQFNFYTKTINIYEKRKEKTIEKDDGNLDNGH